jgi:hypothetical protein
VSDPVLLTPRELRARRGASLSGVVALGVFLNLTAACTGSIGRGGPPARDAGGDGASVGQDGPTAHGDAGGPGGDAGGTGRDAAGSDGGGTASDGGGSGSDSGGTGGDAGPGEPCTSAADCGRCGSCDTVGGVKVCTCPAGYVRAGGACVLDPDPCDVTTCDTDQACVSEAHCMPLGACVATCDCTNCGNCGPDNSDGRWNDWQEYCGNLNASPATMACTRPCPAGDGCLPYSPAICWPMEGCFSL